MRIRARMMNTDHEYPSSQLGLNTISEPQNRALAGVGTPMKEVVWRSSRLNLASRNAEKAAMMKAA